VDAELAPSMVDEGQNKWVEQKGVRRQDGV